jgi:DNA-binding NarL/FixJ family response regulator
MGDPLRIENGAERKAMTGSDQGGPEDSVSVIVDESLFQRLKVLQQFWAACEEFVFVRSSGDLNDLLAACPNSQCCILIVESSALLKSTPAQVCELMRRARSLRVVVRVDNDEIPKLGDLMMSGCSGFITDDTTLPRLRKILGAVTCGEMWFPRRVLSQAFQALVIEQNCNSLSRREREILTLLGQGLSNKQMAERLFISQETLRWHLRNLYAKTRVQGREKLVKYANEFNDAAPRAAAVQEFSEIVKR